MKESRLVKKSECVNCGRQGRSVRNAQSRDRVAEQLEQCRRAV